MGNEKTGFFEEKPGVKSSNRLICFLCLLISFPCAGATLMTDSMVAYYLTLTYVGLAVLGKQGAKIIELAFGKVK